MPAGNLHKLVVPVDATGLQFGRPSDQVLWRKLTNVVLRDGFIETRPGLTAVGPMAQDLTNLPGMIVSLEEVTQYQNIGTTFASPGTDQPQESLAPDSTTGGSWTGNHLDVDEDPPNNGSTKMVSTAVDDTARLGFTDATNTYDLVDMVYLYIRARSATGGLNTIEVAYGGTATESGGVSTTPAADILANLVVSNQPYTDDFSEGAEPGWMDFMVPVPVPIQNTSVFFWNQATLDAFSVDLTLRTPSSVPDFASIRTRSTSFCGSRSG